MLIGTFDKAKFTYYVEIFYLPLSNAFGWVVFRGARAYVVVDGVADSEKSAEVAANKWLLSAFNFAKAGNAFIMSTQANPFFDCIENIPVKERPYSLLGQVWNNICVGYPTEFLTPEEEMKWEWKLRSIVTQTANDANYEYQRTKDGTIIWQRKKEPSNCPWRKSNNIFLQSDISDAEDEEF
jgi:hypothetical protein